MTALAQSPNSNLNQSMSIYSLLTTYLLLRTYLLLTYYCTYLHISILFPNRSGAVLCTALFYVRSMYYSSLDSASTSHRPTEIGEVAWCPPATSHLHQSTNPPPSLPGTSDSKSLSVLQYYCTPRRLLHAWGNNEQANSYRLGFDCIPTYPNVSRRTGYHNT